METKLVRHVRDLVLLVFLLGEDGHGSLGLVPLWKDVARLRELSAQDLHDAVRISVVVDGAALSWGPDEYELVSIVSAGCHWALIGLWHEAAWT